jgi:energy-coupling factor transporter transmembrane protein EcfT
MKLQIRVSNNSANKCTVKGKLEKHVLHKRKVADFQVTLVASLSLPLSLSISLSLSLSWTTVSIVSCQCCEKILLPCGLRVLLLAVLFPVLKIEVRVLLVEPRRS